nr:transposase [Dictyobacter aurantiacus]
METGKGAGSLPNAIRSLCEDEEHLLTYYDFPPVMHRYIRTANAIERFFSNVRQRTDQSDSFTTETSCLTIVWATMFPLICCSHLFARLLDLAKTFSQ